MKEQNKHTDVSKCIHCGKCTGVCAFLEKYKIDIGNTKSLQELAYHCFLCGKCTEVCPVGIDGRQTILDIRRKKVRENSGKLREKGYGLLLWEKQEYRFRNYKNGGTKSVLFPGCNFPSFYPETMKYLAELLWEKAGIGTVYDCCGKPVSELGLEAEEERIIHGLNERLRAMGVEEVIILCPTCYAFLKGKLVVRIISIYDKLRELGLGYKVEEKVKIFLPCPDRETQELLAQIRPFLAEEPELLKDRQCCGLGGCAGIREPELACVMARDSWRTADGVICTYCASCSGNLKRGGRIDPEHLLVKILGKSEEADTKCSLFNRIKTKYRKEKRI